MVDICDGGAFGSLFVLSRGEVVFHASALKHLSTLEAFPARAWSINVGGTLLSLEVTRWVISKFRQYFGREIGKPRIHLGPL